MIYESTGGIKDRKRAVLQKFKGVDTSSPVYAIDHSRASAMRNFININGANHKRPGWRQFARFKDTSGNDLKINGYFDVTIAETRVKIVYAGRMFYVFNGSSYDPITSAPAAIISDCSKVDFSLLEDRKASMFVYDDKAYFVGMGDILVLGKFSKDGTLEMRRVYGDENTFIPRTTTNIPPNETELDENQEPITYGNRQTDRDVNLLTPFRYNELIGSMAVSEGDYTRSYKLDCELIDRDGFEVECYDYDPETGEKTEHTLHLADYTEDESSSNEEVSAAESDEPNYERRNVVVGDLIGEKTLEFPLPKRNGSTLAGATDEPGATARLDGKPGATILNAGDYKIVVERTIGAFASDGTTPYYRYSYYEEKVESSTEVRTLLYYLQSDGWNYVFYAGDDTNFIKNSSGRWVLRRNVPAGCVVTKLDEEYFGNRAWGSPMRPTADLPELFNLEDDLGEKYGVVDLADGILAMTVAMRSIAGEPNIKVKFGYTQMSQTSKILGCTFGAYFGANGGTNTLFLSGNSECKNLDFWSEAEDFTYFPSGNYCRVGTENTAVKGYIRLGDSSLAILKEASYNEPTLYVRTGEETTTYKDSEERTHVTDGYYKTVGKFITEGCVADGSCAMFAGDAVFLSKKGLFGITISTDSIAVEQRVARERSRFINELFRKHRDLSKAVSIVFDNRLYIALDDAVYVADARFKSNERGDMSDTFNYEWWVWDNCPVREWYEIDGELCFGTEDGRLCVFDKEYTDRTYEAMTTTVDVANNRITPGLGNTITEDSLVQIKGSAYRLLFAAASMELASGCIKVSDDDILDVRAGQYVYADTVTGTGLSVNTKYIITDVDYAEGTFKLTTAAGAAVTPTATGFRLLCSLDGEVCKVNVGDDNGDLYFTLKNYYSGDVYVIATYNGASPSAEFREYFVKNVVAEWYTPVLDMGSNDYVKQLLSLTIATEQVTNGRLSFGWETRGADSLVDIDSKGFDVFDFGNLNFERFAFDTGFSTSFSRKVKASFNFIIFRFVSDNECDCCVHSFTIGYKINRRNKGVF